MKKKVKPEGLYNTFQIFSETMYSKVWIGLFLDGLHLILNHF